MTGMEVLLAITLGVLSYPSDDSPRPPILIPPAAIQFVPPKGFQTSSVPYSPPDVPWIWKGGETQQGGYLYLFLVPPNPNGELDDPRPGLEIVAAELEGFVGREGWSEEILSSPTEPTYLFQVDTLGYRVMASRRVASRTFGAILTAKEPIHGGEAWVVDVVNSIAPIAAGDPALQVAAAETERDRAGERFTDSHLGFRFNLPVGFAFTSQPKGTLAQAFLKPHFGIYAELRASRVDDHLDLPLRDAAEQVRASFESTLGTLTPIAADRFGPFDAYRWGVSESDFAGGGALVELKRHRIAIAWLTDAVGEASLLTLFEQSLASLRPAPIDRKVELAETYRDSESGFSFRPPTEFVRVPGGDGLVTFEEPTLPPRRRLIIDRIDEISRDADDVVELARARQVQLGEPTESIKRSLLNGVPTASYYAAGDPADTTSEHHTLLTSPYGTFELTLQFRRNADEDLLARVQRSLLSFRFEKRTLPPELAPRVTNLGATDSISPPRDWTSEQRDDGTLLIVEPDQERPARMETGRGVLLPIDSSRDRSAPLGPRSSISLPSNPLVGGDGRIANAITHALESEGCELVRIEDARKETDDTLTLRIAYTVDGKPLRELRVVHAQGNDFGYARGVAPADRFPELRPLFEASLRSFQSEVR